MTYIYQPIAAAQGKDGGIFSTNLRNLALTLVLGFSAGCSNSDHAAPIAEGKGTSAISDPDYRRWRDTLVTAKSELAFKEYLEKAKQRSSVHTEHELTFETTFDYSVAIDALKRSQNLLDLAKQAQQFLSHRELPDKETPLAAALHASLPLEADQLYRQWSDNQDFSDKAEYNCEEMVVSFLANLLSAEAAMLPIGKRISIAVVTGMYFDPKLPGKGGGHVWLKLSEDNSTHYIDPTADLDRGRIEQIALNDERFIAIAEQAIILEKSSGQLKISKEPATLYRLPAAQ